MSEAVELREAILNAFLETSNFGETLSRGCCIFLCLISRRSDWRLALS